MSIASATGQHCFFLCLLLQGDWIGNDWREEDKTVQTETTQGLGKITEQKGILGPGPAELRFAEAL